VTTTSAEARQSDFGAAYIGLLALSVGSVLLVGAGRVRDQAYWGDEAVTAAIVRRPLGGLVRVLWSQEAGMGPYYAALWAWSRVFGTDAGLRMFSVVGIAVAVGFAFDLTWRWFGSGEAVAVSAVLIANPFALRYLVEARTYAWMMAFGIALVWVVDRWRQNPTPALTAGVGVTAGLLAALHVAAVPFLAAVAVAVAATTNKDLWWNRRSLVIGAISAAIFAFSVPAILARTGQLDWIAPITPSNLEPIVERLYGEGWWAACAAGGLLAFGLGASRASRWQRTVLLCGTLLTPALLALISIVHSLWIPRYLAPTFPLAAVAAVAGVSGSWRRLSARAPGARFTNNFGAALIGLAAIATLVMAGPFTDNSPYRDGMRSAVATITAELQPGDLVIASDQEHMPLYHYLGQRTDLVPTLPAQPVDRELYPVEADLDDITDRLNRAPRVFVVRNAHRPLAADIRTSFKGWKRQTLRFDRVSVEVFSNPT